MIRACPLSQRYFVVVFALLLSLQLSSCSWSDHAKRTVSQQILLERLETRPLNQVADTLQFSSPSNTQSLEQQTPAQLIPAQGWLLLDVRSPQEYAEGHIPGAVNIDHRELGDRLDELQGFQLSEVIVYCERGVRAGRAEKILSEAGFTNVRQLEGDISAWRDRSLPLVSGAEAMKAVDMQNAAVSPMPTDSIATNSTPAVRESGVAQAQEVMPWVVTASVAKQLIEQGATLLDARGKGLGKKAFPGAMPVQWQQFTPDNPVTRGYLLADDQRLGAELRSLGISNDIPVVVLGNPPQGWGEDGRIVWMLRSLGHPQAVLVDGGVDALRASGVETSRSRLDQRPGNFVVQRTDAWDITQEQLQAQLESDNPPLLIDTRETREYQGKTPYGEQRGGHVPGAIHLYFKDLMTADGMLLPDTEIREQLAAIGITPDKTIVAYCTGGIRSGWLTAVLTDLGYSVRNYAGSMWEWSAGPRDRYPLEKVPQKDLKQERAETELPDL